MIGTFPLLPVRDTLVQPYRGQSVTGKDPICGYLEYGEDIHCRYKIFEGDPTGQMLHWCGSCQQNNLGAGDHTSMTGGFTK